MDFFPPMPARPDRRIRRRWNVMWPAILEVEGRGYGCTILDLSDSGAKLDCYGLPRETTAGTLKCQNFGALEVTMAWIRNGQAGVRFEKSPAEIVELLKPLVPGMGRRGAPTVQLEQPQQRAQRARFGRLRVPVIA